MSGRFSSRQFIGAFFVMGIVALSYYWPFGNTTRRAHPAYVAGESLQLSDKKQGRLAVLSENADILRRWTMPFPVHSVAHNIAHPWQLLAIQDKGTGAAVVDARISNKPDFLQAPEGSEFAGHGAFSAEGDKIFISAQKIQTQDGQILIYDSSTFELLGQMSSGGKSPHDLQLDFKTSDLIAIANQGSEKDSANLSWISISQEQVSRQVTADGKASIRHFLQASEKEIYTLGFSSFGKLDEDKIQFTPWSEKKSGEILNAYLDSMQGKIWLTIPSEDSILVLEQKSLNISTEFKAEKPGSILAITPHSPELLMISVSLQKDGSGLQKSFDLKTAKGTDEALEHPRKFYSLHVTTLQVELEEM